LVNSKKHLKGRKGVMKTLFNWLRSEESGQGMVEYGLIIVVVALVAVVALSGVGNQLVVAFNNIVARLGGTT
jgi:pilus assembly protein Flp/PilA